MNIKSLKILALVGVISASVDVSANLLDETVSEEKNGLVASKKSQSKIDVIYAKKSDAIQDIRITKAEISQLQVYNNQLKAIISDQDKQKISFEKQLKDIEVTQRGIMPLMERMLTMLDQFIELDMPFLLEERRLRGTIEAYRSKDDSGRIVDYLRLGRVGLFYIGLNSADAFAWSQQQGSWLELDSDYKASINKGIQIARKQSAPALLDLQLPSLGGIQ